MSWCIKINCEMELNHIFNFTSVQCDPGLQGQPCICATQQLRIWPPSPPKIWTHWEPEDIERSKKQKIKDGKIKRLIGEEWRGAFCRLFVLREDVLPLVQVSSSSLLLPFESSTMVKKIIVIVNLVVIMVRALLEHHASLPPPCRLTLCPHPGFSDCHSQISMPWIPSKAFFLNSLVFSFTIFLCPLLFKSLLQAVWTLVRGKT